MRYSIIYATIKLTNKYYQQNTTQLFKRTFKKVQQNKNETPIKLNLFFTSNLLIKKNQNVKKRSMPTTRFYHTYALNV